MYRLLIVDDEEFITDSLAEVFGRQQAVELDICKAYSGREALAWLNSTRIDVVLTDIRMPGVSGLDLMSRIRRDWPRCRIVFLTGFDDFDSVYQAVQAQGVKYLLKTEGYPKVVQAVLDTIRELEEKSRNEYLLEQAREQRNSLETLAQGGLIRHLLYGPAVGTPADRAANFRRLGIPLHPAAPVHLVLGSLILPKSDGSFADKQEAALAVTALADHYLKDLSAGIGIVDRYGDLLWLVQPLDSQAESRASPEPPDSADSPDDASARMTRFLEGTLELVQSACLDSFGAAVSFTISGSPVEWEGLADAYERLRQMQHDRAGDGADMVMTVPPDSGGSPEAAHDLVRREPCDLLAGHLEAGRREACIELLQQLAGTVLDRKCPDTAYVMEAYYAIALVLLSYVNRRKLHDRISVASLMRFDAHQGREEAFRYLERTADSLLAIRREHETNRAESAMANIRAYIEDHLQEDLSLVRLSKRFHFNPSYLSRLFKQVVGTKLSDYIEEARARKAKELLAQDAHKIHEIGIRVGYESPHSFTRFFKKRTGLAPQEFRESARKNGASG